MNAYKSRIVIVTMFLLVLCPARSQNTSRNYVKTVTMLDAGGTDSLQAMQYYNGLGYPTVSVAYQFPRPRDTLSASWSRPLWEPLSYCG
jgi:hypothetical protein